MANKKSQPENFVEAVFNGSISEAANTKSQPQPTQPVAPAASPAVYNGFGSSTMIPQPTFQPYGQQAAAVFHNDCCKSLIPGTTISTYARCTGAEFVVDNWKLGGLYRIETTDHQCVAFLTKKTPEVLEFSSVDDKGENVVFEIKANDLCSDFKETRETYPYSCVYNVPTNPIIIYPVYPTR
jgi:hypothetical protein